MPPRRAHTKSRHGCDQCKRRRVKCDESGPPCANCVSRELTCTYLRAPAKGIYHVQPPTHTPAPIRNLSPLQPVILSPASNRPTVSGVRDVELMHKFATETYDSLFSSYSGQQTWQIFVPRMALQHDYLMNGILALGALHIATSLEPPASLAYIDTALHHHNLTFAPFRAAINNISPLNSEAVLAQSIVTTVIGIALPRLTSTRGESPSITENIVVVFELLQGVKNIYQLGRSWIKLDFFSRQMDFWKTDGADLDDETRAALDRLVTLNDETLATIDTDQHRINKDVLASLRHCYARFINSPDPANVLAWLAAVDKEFVDNVARRQPLALLILMHWGVLLGELDGHWWWARNSGRALISELLQALQPGDLRWSNALSWPQRKMGL
ncbi:hypothetical protein NUU61_008388 [Penicillium alfredii]|uniref:Zn(2)-C6 fungal-type domain-containing protein n=1 Tax=Penicillium alfredii TaxID=1506179 RepID=A0A9W9ESE2_9EURO|nr:uncharacterized protein NUU61_008388 [Penicillium alfredii]KAJ5087081.1 hypothetical protein NUU61_008388 [Penicillium alfredii]